MCWGESVVNKQMKQSIMEEGKDAPPKRERTTWQLDVYSKGADLYPPQTSPDLFSPT